MPSAITNTTYSFNAVPLLEEVAHVTNVNDNKNLTGKYAIYTPYPTYLDRSTLYMKHGDTINVPITNPSGGAIGFVSGNAANGTARQQYPVPTSTSTTSGGTFSLTWPSSLADNNPQTSGNNTSFTNDTQWPIFGYPYASGNSHSGSNVVSGSGGIAGVLRPGYKYSRKIRISIVTGQIGFDTGETKSITQGATSLLIYSGSTITGLNKVIHNNTNSPTHSSQFPNKLYLSVWNSSGTQKFTNSTVSGKWGLGSTWLGFISDSNPTISLNTASLVAGTYRIYLNHYSGATLSPNPGDRRVAADSRLYYITLTVVAPASDSTPEFATAFGNVTQSSVTSTHTTSAVNLLNYDVATTLTAITSGAAYSINGGTFSTTVPAAVPLAANVRLQGNSNSTFGGTISYTTTIGGVTSTPWTITNMAQPTGGGTTSGASGTASHGIAVLKPGATTQVLNQDMRVTNLVKKGVTTMTAGNTTVVSGQRYSVYVTGVENLNATSDIAVLYQIVGNSGSNVSPQLVDVDYDSANNRFRFSINSTTALITVYWNVVRY